ncbi:thiamine kinase [Erwinia tasmaniensis]|uniref:Thiamine kinase n=1 Tax=Erwinia tasmaniensis (strain DSM 17950 / CFBP 7177 / CIP 109463 / NCPPB 4357 / Et1/99) TaxID=465817 RepID=B2VDM7_ERWT9|nr:thiamine kinase [Erwinia tasmaniensis]CAO97056.1 Thiamine kinase [Erwinia tasmaniensis Et1/99]
MTSFTDPELQRLLKQHFPAASAAASFLPLDGLSGFSLKVKLAGRTLLARRVARGAMMPGVDRQREYRLLRKLASSGRVPQVYGCSRDWLLLSWQPGEPLTPPQLVGYLEPLIGEVVKLHRLPLTGYRLQLLPLLMSYWQRSDARRRNTHWLRALQRCQRLREPRPLRLGVLHMDIHSANLLADGERLRFIDWEYAGDGDVALELAAIIGGNGLDSSQQQLLIATYGRLQHIDEERLRHQVARWQPWLELLAASWYELRWQQSGEQHFHTLAAEGWQRVTG